MGERGPAKERRRWSRLPLAIPVFVRSHDQSGNDSLEFATSLNVSAGGMLLAVRRAFKPEAQVRLEIPSAPVAATPTIRVARTLQGKALRVASADGYYILGVKFIRPLRIGNRPTRKRKIISTL
jgi:PilZ domain